MPQRRPASRTSAELARVRFPELGGGEGRVDVHRHDVRRSGARAPDGVGARGGVVGVHEGVREAHRSAVTAALTETEKYVQARMGGNAPAENTGIVSAPTAVPTPGKLFTRLPTPTAVVVAVLAGITAPAKLAMIDLPRFSENGTP